MTEKMPGRQRERVMSSSRLRIDGLPSLLPSSTIIALCRDDSNKLFVNGQFHDTWMSDSRELHLYFNDGLLFVNSIYRNAEVELKFQKVDVEYPGLENLVMLLGYDDQYYYKKFLEDYLFFNRRFSIFPYVLTNTSLYYIIKSLLERYDARFGEYSAISSDNRNKSHSPDEKALADVLATFNHLANFQRSMYEFSLHGAIELKLNRFSCMTLTQATDRQTILTVIEEVLSRIVTNELEMRKYIYDSSKESVEFSILNSVLMEENIGRFISDLQEDRYIVSKSNLGDVLSLTVLDKESDAVVYLSIPLGTKTSMQEEAYILTSEMAPAAFVRDTLNRISKYLGKGLSIE
ncbi:hypothetical protein IT575_11135 [bacterium]|nr:hypothetical protein [bacterium]